MENQSTQHTNGNGTPDHSEREIPFDATTNFSLLGWLWDKIKRAGSSKQIIEFILKK